VIWRYRAEVFAEYGLDMRIEKSSLNQATVQTPGKHLDVTLHFEFEQTGLDGHHWEMGSFRELVHGYRIMSGGVEQALSISAEHGGWRLRFRDGAWRLPAQFFQNILRRFHQLRALPDQLVAAFGKW
jgi:hypothetical protein